MLINDPVHEFVKCVNLTGRFRLAIGSRDISREESVCNIMLFKEKIDRRSKVRLEEMSDQFHGD